MNTKFKFEQIRIGISYELNVARFTTQYVKCQMNVLIVNSVQCLNVEIGLPNMANSCLRISNYEYEYKVSDSIDKNKQLKDPIDIDYNRSFVIVCAAYQTEHRPISMKSITVTLIVFELCVFILAKKHPIVINTWHFQSAGEKGRHDFNRNKYNRILLFCCNPSTLFSSLVHCR